MSDALRLVILASGLLLIVVIWLWSVYARRRSGPFRAGSRRARARGNGKGRASRALPARKEPSVPLRIRKGENLPLELGGDPEDERGEPGLPPLGVDFPGDGERSGDGGRAPLGDSTGSPKAAREKAGRGTQESPAARTRTPRRRRRPAFPGPAPGDSARDPDLSAPELTGSAGGLEGLRATREGPEHMEIDRFDLSTDASREAEDGEGETVPEDDEPPAETLVVILTVLAPKGERIEGDALRVALETQGLRHGEDRVFHRYPSPAPAGVGPLFSAVNIVEPGVFDLETMDSIQTPGVGLFMRLPGPKDPGDAFATMVETARALAKALDAQLCDETRSKLTAQALNHLREQIADFGRRRLLRV